MILLAYNFTNGTKKIMSKLIEYNKNARELHTNVTKYNDTIKQQNEITISKNYLNAADIIGDEFSGNYLFLCLSNSNYKNFLKQYLFLNFTI